MVVWCLRAIEIPMVVEAVIDGETGYMNGNSGGGAALDKEANHCLFKTRVFKIGQVASGL